MSDYILVPGPKGNTYYQKVSGLGSQADPYIPISNGSLLDSSGNLIDMNNPLNVREQAFIDVGNSSNTPLIANASFVGTPFEILQFGVISIAVYSDVASATDGLMIEQSVDGITDWHWADHYTIPAGIGKSYQVQPSGDYLRITYTNGPVDQTNFHVHVVVHPDYIKPSSHRIQDDIVDEDDAELVKAVLTGRDGGLFTNVKVTQDGNLSIVNKAAGLSIAAGDVTGYSNLNKFGNIPDFDFASGEAFVWDGADAGNENLMTYTFSSTADIDRLSSSDNGDTQDIEILGLDIDGNEVTQTIALTGQTPVALTTPLYRFSRMINRGSVDISGRVYCFVNVATTGGVPNTLTNIRGMIIDGNNQSEMAIFPVPAGKTAYIGEVFASTAGGSRVTNYSVKLKIRPPGEIFQLKHRRAITDEKDLEKRFDTPEKATAGSDIIMTAEILETGVTNASVSAGFDIVLVDN